MATWPKQRRLLGKKHTRIDGPAKATGTAKYSYDINRKDMLHGVILRCPYAHAKLTTLDWAAAEKMPGVKAVHPIVKVGAELFYAGDEILGLAADTEEHAFDALRAVDAKYEQLDFQVREEDVLEKDKKTVPPSAGNRSNLRVAFESNTGDIAAGFKAADATIEGEYGVSTICHQCLEPHGLVAEWDGEGNLTVWASTQAVTGTAGQLRGYFQLKAGQVKCITHNMGGGYGSKFGPDIQGYIAAELAKKAGKPVKLMLTRADEITAGGNRPSAYAKIKMGGTKDGTITAYEIDSWGSPGVANSATVGPLPYVYPIPNSKRKHTMLRMNTGSLRAMRAPGHPQSCYLTDCPLDDLAAALDIDPMKMRLKNLPPNDENAIKNAPRSYNALRNTIYTDEIKIAAKMIDWEKNWHAPGKGAEKGPVKTGLGMALHTWGGSAATPNEVKVTISKDGSVLVQSSTQDLGTAQRTLLPIVVAEVLGLEVSDITVQIGESQFGQSSGSGGSTTTPGTAPHAYNAALAVLDNLFDKVADKLKAKKEDLAIEPGMIFDKGNNKRYPWKQACARLGEEPATGVSQTADKTSAQLLRDLTNVNVGGVQIAEVKVDIETGVVRCTRFVAVQDCGLVVNLQGCISQVAGGVIMGLNYALFEERVMDRRTGRQLNADMEFYKLGGMKDMPHIQVHMHDMPERGVIGIGEPPTISTAAAIGNAIHNAIGVRVGQAPFTPDRVLAALDKKKGGK
jgi:xanthine dehydrogenase YagR molybdenum-binding subunit